MSTTTGNSGAWPDSPVLIALDHNTAMHHPIALAGQGDGAFGSHRIRHATATLLVNNRMPLEEVSRYLGHSSTDVTRRYARQTPDALGRRAADALERSGLVAI